MGKLTWASIVVAAAAPGTLGAPPARAEESALTYAWLEAGSGLTGLGEDLFVTLHATTHLVIERDWQLALHVPLRLRLWDEAPRSRKTIRQEDWDEVSDFARLVPLVLAGSPDGPFFARLGLVSAATLGQGSLIDQYAGAIDIDHPQGSLFARMDFDLVGGELLVDDLLDPSLAASRCFVRPLEALAGLPEALRRIVVGATLGADFRAPTAVAQDEAGRLLPDTHFRPRVTADAPLWFAAADLAVPLVEIAPFDLLPYLEVATLEGRGAGVHGGAWLTFRFAPEVSLATRLEAAVVTGQHLPGYFSPTYEVERFQYRDGLTKLGWLRQAPERSPRWAFRFEQSFDYRGMVTVAASVADAEGPGNARVVVRAELHGLGPVAVQLSYARVGLDAARDLVDPHQTMAGVLVRVQLGRWVALQARLANEWWLEHREGASAFRTSPSFDLGTSVALAL